MSNVCFHDPAFEKVLSDKNDPDHKSLVRCLMFLSLCHTIIIDKKTKAYNASSPDELALAHFAKQVGFEFVGPDSQDRLCIKRDKGDVIKYKLLNVLEFTSTRKRMSIIVEDPNGQKILMCKGADSIIKERLSQSSLNSEEFKETQAAVDECARIGLRTLFLAEKKLDDASYDEWNKKSYASKLVIDGREEAIAKVDELIEKEMELIGSTAIEDRLQENVADTINFMKDVGIKVWVLTGDKIETAINIGYSAGLLNDNMPQHIIDDMDKKMLSDSLSKT